MRACLSRRAGSGSFTDMMGGVDLGLLGKIDRYKAAIDELRPFEGDLLAGL